MDRTLAGRLGLGAISRQPARPRKGAPAARRRTRGRAPVRRDAGLLDLALARIVALLAAVAHLTGDCWALVRARRRLRTALIVLAIAAPLLGGGWLWLRGSSLVAVRDVSVSGAHGADAGAIDAALRSAGRGMTTLEVNRAALRSAVAAYPVISDLKVSTSFPHTLRIHVVEQQAVAALTVGGAKTAVAANGVVLGASLASGSLPAVSGSAALSPGQRVRSPASLQALAVLGAAPAQLARQVTRAYSSAKGLTLSMHGGLLVYFGDASRPHAKWLALSRVLADSGSAGASYVDVRQPERPAAGFPGGVAPSSGGSEEATSTTAPTNGESTQALAEGLSAAAGGGAAATGPASGSSSGEESQAKPEESSATGEGESIGAAAPQPGG